MSVILYSEKSLKDIKQMRFQKKEINTILTKQAKKYTVIYMCLGMAIGTAIGVALNNLSYIMPAAEKFE